MAIHAIPRQGLNIKNAAILEVMEMSQTFLGTVRSVLALLIEISMIEFLVPFKLKIDR